MSLPPAQPPTSTPTSLRARLLWAVGLSTLLLWSLAAGISYHSARQEAISLLDGQLAQSARLLMAQVMHEDNDLEDGHPAEKSSKQPDHHEATEVILEWMDTSAEYENEAPLEFQLWALGKAVFDPNSSAQLLLRSEHSPALPMQTTVGFTDMHFQNKEWRVFSARDPSAHYQLQVMQPTQLRDEAALTAALHTLIPLAVLLPLLLLLIHLAVGRAIKPLNHLADAVTERAPDALTPLPNLPMPSEAQPLVFALNGLLSRLQRALDNERRFTADASHELRTPLAAIQVQSQVAQAAHQCDDAPTLAHALKQIDAGVKRATHLVEQLLRLARLDPLSGLPNGGRFNPASAYQEARSSLAQEALERGVTVNQEAIPEGLSLAGDATMMGIALRNLLENALHHTPPGGSVTLGIDESPQSVTLWVRDTGPGINADELAHLTERFYRGRDSQQQGSGLGLAIVQRIAEIHGAKLRLENLPTGGFEASIIVLRG